MPPMNAKDAARLRHCYIERLAQSCRGWWNAPEEERAEAMKIRKALSAMGVPLTPIPPTPEQCGARWEQLQEIARRKAQAAIEKAQAEAKKSKAQ